MYMKHILSVLMALTVYPLFARAGDLNMKITYPETRKSTQTDSYFGTEVADPYRWLEDDNSTETLKWAADQNKVTFDYLSRIPYREKLRARAEELYNYAKYTLPLKAGDYYLFTKNDGLQSQAVIYIQKGEDGAPQVFLDPNTLSKDGTVTAELLSFSKDNRYAAIARNEAGSDWTEIRVLKIPSGKELPDRVRWVKFSGAAWQGDSFYYNRYAQPAAGAEKTAKNQFGKLYRHTLGEPQEKDVLIYEDKTDPDKMFSAGTTEDERFLVMSVSKGTDNYETWYMDLSMPEGRFIPLFTGFTNKSDIIDNIGGKFIVKTNIDAARGRVILVDPAKPSKENWTVLIPEQKETLEGITTAGWKIFASYLKDAAKQVRQYDYNGKLERDIALPGLGDAYGFSGRHEDTAVFFKYTSFVVPSSTYRYDIISGETKLSRKSEAKLDPDLYETRQVFVTSKDGTRVPMFILSRKGLKLDGTNPAVLYGYGGFRISMTPYFDPLNILLLENGAIYAVANLRGGAEYGEEWHKAGMLFKKQNVFDDFIAAAQYLVKEKYTSPEKLGINGGSNGGLLIGACMTQRPELFKVALPEVGVLDMLRFHKFTIGYAWADEYGSSDKEDQFKYLYSYSPLHNLKAGVKYPATMVFTADHDDRVVPAHSFKFISTLQADQAGDNPVLIRIETRAGHGAGKPTSKILDEAADRWAFFFANTGTEIK